MNSRWIQRFAKPFLLCLLAISLALCGGCGTKEESPVTPQTGLSYDVSNACFAFSGFECLPASDGGSYTLTVTGTCTVSLYAYTVTVKAYGAQGQVLFQETKTCEQTVEAEQSFSVSFAPTAQQGAQITRVDATYAGRSRQDPTGKEVPLKTFSVTFLNDTQQVSQVSIEEGSTVSPPQNPTRENYLFDGWYTDAACTKTYDFSQRVTGDLTLYAGFRIDAATLTNTITQNTMHAVVTVYNTVYNTFWGMTTASETHQGSGFIFHMADGRYYVLTNCHVACGDAAYQYQKFEIEDYQGNRYAAYLYTNEEKGGAAIDPDYDMACLYFQATSTQLTALPIATADPALQEDVISLGSPKNQANAITYGKVEAYTPVQVSDATPEQSNVTFAVIRHTARINNGSSGGPLLNGALQVVGLNYAGNETTGFAVPTEKMWEFLTQYVYS